MKAARTLLVNTIMLTATSLLMRGVGVFFQLYIAEEMGAAGVGLQQLIMSVYSLALTVACSGIKLTATRLVSEELGTGGGGVRSAMRACLCFCALLGLSAAAGLYSLADMIALRWLDDLRAVYALRILALTLPMAAFSAAAGGYFTAVQRLAAPAGLQVAEQLVRIAVTVLLLRPASEQGLTFACASVAVGALAGELFGAVSIALLYLRDVGRQLSKWQRKPGMARRLVSISVPVALSLYARMSLSTAENILTPKGLRGSGLAAELAVGTYGVIEGMVFPVIMLPCAFIVVLAELMIPELTESQVTGRRRRINYMMERVFRFALPFTVWVAAVFIAFSEEIGGLVFSDASASRYLRLLAPMVLVVYIDAISDGMLKGLGEYVASLRYSIADSLLGVLMVILLLPRFGIGGYIFITIFTKAFNCTLGLNRLCRVTQYAFPIRRLLGAACCAALSCAGIRASSSLLFAGAGGSTAGTLALVGASTAAYVLLVLLSGTVTGEDAGWLGGIIRE